MLVLGPSEASARGCSARRSLLHGITMGLTDVQKAKTRPTVNNLFGTDARIFVRLKTLGSGIQDLQIMVQSLRVVEDKLG